MPLPLPGAAGIAAAGHTPHIEGMMRGRRPGPGPGGDDSGAGDRGSEKLRPERAGRGRLPHRPEVGVDPRRPGGEQVRHLQRRRGGPRRLHGPQHPGRGSSQRPGRNDHRRLRRGRQPGPDLCPGGVPPGRPEIPGGHRRGPEDEFPGREHLGTGLQLRHRGPDWRRAFVCGEESP